MKNLRHAEGITGSHILQLLHAGRRKIDVPRDRVKYPQGPYFTDTPIVLFNGSLKSVYSLLHKPANIESFRRPGCTYYAWHEPLPEFRIEQLGDGEFTIERGMLVERTRIYFEERSADD